MLAGPLIHSVPVQVVIALTVSSSIVIVGVVAAPSCLNIKPPKFVTAVGTVAQVNLNALNSNICFSEGSIVSTDQGDVEIQNIDITYHCREVHYKVE